MTKKMINIRLEENIWKRAKLDAALNNMTLQDWITFLIEDGGDPGYVPTDEYLTFFSAEQHAQLKKKGTL